MTKEELISYIEEYLEFSIKDASCLNTIINEFFNSNICIPKGENRNPYANEWHQVLEGAKFQSYNQTRDDFEDDQWIGYPIRIKPSEPVAKYKYAYIDYDGNIAISDHISEEYASTHIINRTKATRLDWSMINE